MVPKREVKFFALIIPAKDVEEFIKSYPRDWEALQAASTHYSQLRTASGRKPFNNYIIVNQDEPYAKEIWDRVLAGEAEKEARQ